MSQEPPSPARHGIILGLGAYCAWGIMPLYFVMVREVPAWQMLCHRVAWSFMFLAALILLMNKWNDFRAIGANRKIIWILAITAFLIAGNWLFFIIAVSARQVQQASLGYYISPILSVVMGMAIYGEKMRHVQWISFAFALIGAIYLSWMIGTIPFLAIGLAITFSFYGLFRKMSDVDAVIGLAWETTILLPFGIVGIIYSLVTNMSVITVSPQGLWIPASGIITIVPLLLFTAATTRLPMVLLGFFQYISPTIQLLIATYILNEELDTYRLPGFAMIWLALSIISAEALWVHYKGKPSEGIPV